MEITNARNIKDIIIFALLVSIGPVSVHEKKSELIYIVLWTYTRQPWIYRSLETGQGAFTSRNCFYQNCFITTSQSYFDSVLDFDVLVFNAVHLSHYNSSTFPLPTNRSESQLYILASIEPAAYNLLPDYFNKIFNLTWTYKLNSDIVNPYIIVKNNSDKIIGPKVDMSWTHIEDLPPINNDIKQKLINKRLAALWVASDCYAKERFIYILNLQYELKSKYELQVDIFGRCGDESACPKKDIRDKTGLLSSNCYNKIQSDYYFYLAFENCNIEDYVSEKLLHGLNHFAVPIVFGGANYTRFLPDGIYLDALKLGVENLAKEMHDIINDQPRYHNFFKWHGYYSFHDSADENFNDTVCQLCKFLNENRKHNGPVRIYDTIVGWWNVPVPDNFPRLYSFRELGFNESTTTPIEIHEEPEGGNFFVSNIFNFLDGE